MLKQFQRSYLSDVTFIQRTMQAISQLNSEQIRIRRDSKVKKILEEILPISYFLQHLSA